MTARRFKNLPHEKWRPLAPANMKMGVAFGSFTLIQIQCPVLAALWFYAPCHSAAEWIDTHDPNTGFGGSSFTPGRLTRWVGFTWTI